MAKIAPKSESMEIPQDIIENIIAALGDTRLLKQCALVSSSFLLPSRKQLFSRITLRNSQICDGIHQFLVQNPVIQSFVRTIVLKDVTSKFPEWITEWMNGTSLLAILRLPFARLESFELREVFIWNSFSSELKDALSNIMHSSSLKNLTLGGNHTLVGKLPITLFTHIVHLTTLELIHLPPNNFVDEDSSLLTRAASNGVEPMAPQIVIDRCSWYFTKGDVFHNMDGHFEPRFLPFICGLRFLETTIVLDDADMYDYDILSFFMRSLCMSLTSFPATLEHLELNIWFSDDFFTPTKFNPCRFFENLRDADIWRHLDSIATHPAASRLQRVSIKIYYCFYVRSDEPLDENIVSKAVFDGLPSLHTKGILFVQGYFQVYSQKSTV